jgi:hypothetical protein
LGQLPGFELVFQRIGKGAAGRFLLWFQAGGGGGADAAANIDEDVGDDCFDAEPLVAAMTANQTRIDSAGGSL